MKTENHPFPPSLSDRGKERNLICLKFWCMMFMVNLLILLMQDFLMELLCYTYYPLSIFNVSTFDEHVDKIFLPHISKQLESCTQVDIVWDIYPQQYQDEGVNQRKKRERNLKKSGR